MLTKANRRGWRVLGQHRLDSLEDGTKRRQNVWILASHAFTVIPHPPIDMERVRDQADIYTNEQPDIRPHISTAAPTLIHDIPDIVS